MNLAYIATCIAKTLATNDIVFLADDEQQADALSCALAAILPPGCVFFIPSSDTLPGDVTPASPANTGRRVAALRALRVAEQQADHVEQPIARSRRDIGCRGGRTHGTGESVGE